MAASSAPRLSISCPVSLVSLESRVRCIPVCLGGPRRARLRQIEVENCTRSIGSGYPQLKKLRENGYTLKMLVRVFEENGVTITIHALSTYLKNLALPKEQAPVKAASKGTVGPARSHEDLHNLSQDTKTFRILLEDRSVIGDIDPYCSHGDLDRN